MSAAEVNRVLHHLAPCRAVLCFNGLAQELFAEEAVAMGKPLEQITLADVQALVEKVGERYRKERGL